VSKKVSIMFKSFSNSVSRSLAPALLVLALPLAGCITDDWAKDDEAFKPYGGSKTHPIAVAGNKATVEGCGNWSVDAGDAENNQFMPNHGCAVQSNIAAMTAYPQDLVRLRRMSRAPAEGRVAAARKTSTAAEGSSPTATTSGTTSP
jgi:hypothetical protein